MLVTSNCREGAIELSQHLTASPAASRLPPLTEHGEVAKW